MARTEIQTWLDALPGPVRCLIPDRPNPSAKREGFSPRWGAKLSQERLWDALCESTGLVLWEGLTPQLRERWQGLAQSIGAGPRRLLRSRHSEGRWLFISAFTLALADFPDQSLYRDWTLSELIKARKWASSVRMAWSSVHPQWMATESSAALWLRWHHEAVSVFRTQAYEQVRDWYAAADQEEVSEADLREIRQLQAAARRIYDRYLYVCAACASSTAGGCCRGHWMGRFSLLDARAWQAANLTLSPPVPCSLRICPFGSECGCSFPPDFRPIYCASTLCQHSLHPYSETERSELTRIRSGFGP